MRVLIASAGRHGGTHEVAELIAGELREGGHDVEVREVLDVCTHHVERARAVVLGSAVYQGRWQSAAVHLARREAGLLRERRVWLFSTGPLGDDHPVPPPDADVAEVMADTGALGHEVFGGRLRREGLDRRERTTADEQGLPDGDHRDLLRVRAWADRLAVELDRGAVVDLRDPAARVGGPARTGPRPGPSGPRGS